MRHALILLPDQRPNPGADVDDRHLPVILPPTALVAAVLALPTDLPGGAARYCRGRHVRATAPPAFSQHSANMPLKRCARLAMPCLQDLARLARLTDGLAP
jgi:hypothetical protein